MNYSNFLIEIVDTPEQNFFDDFICVTEFLGKIYQTYSQDSIFEFDALFHIAIWGNLDDDINYYLKKNDLIIVEGYVSLRDNMDGFFNDSFEKEISISVFKLYPFLLKREIF